jgi:hypothetical protein
VAVLAVTIAEWPRNDRETIRVRIDSFNGRDIIDVRSWYTDKAGELRPGRAGLTVSIKHLPDLADALTKALVEVEARGLLSETAA